jgi:glutamine synthetase
MVEERITKDIEESGIRLIRAVYCGPDGITRGKAFPPRHLEEVLESGIGLTQAQASVTVFDQLPPESRYQPIGEVRICPDIHTYNVLPYSPGEARLLSDLHTRQGRPWELCPRSLLKEFVDRLRERGFVIESSFENEFVLYKDVGGEWRPLHDMNCFSSAAMDASSESVLPMLEALEAQGIAVEKYFPEAGPGQQEIPVRHRRGVAAADQQVVFRETVRGVAAARGLRASFMPKPNPNSAGNGCHIHFSLWDPDGGRNLFFDPSAEHELSEVGRRFAAGLLAHLPALLALTAPTTNSYRRFAERCWSSCYVCWGPDNREASVRVASSFRGREEASLNLEYRPADPTCNPYLALAAIICAGLDGIDRRMDPGEPTVTDPALLPPAERESKGLLRYPADLSSALTALERDDVLRRGLGEGRVRDYLVMKRAEVAAVAAIGDGAEEKAYKFRF